MAPFPDCQNPPYNSQCPSTILVTVHWWFVVFNVVVCLEALISGLSFGAPEFDIQRCYAMLPSPTKATLRVWGAARFRFIQVIIGQPLWGNSTVPHFPPLSEIQIAGLDVFSVLSIAPYHQVSDPSCACPPSWPNWGIARSRWPEKPSFCFICSSPMYRLSEGNTVVGFVEGWHPSSWQRRLGELPGGLF